MFLEVTRGSHLSAKLTRPQKCELILHFFKNKQTSFATNVYVEENAGVFGVCRLFRRCWVRHFLLRKG